MCYVVALIADILYRKLDVIFTLINHAIYWGVSWPYSIFL